MRTIMEEKKKKRRTKRKVKVSNNNWRTSSRQFFANSDKTSWVVRLVDEKGQVINALNFDVIYQ